MLQKVIQDAKSLLNSLLEVNKQGFRAKTEIAQLKLMIERFERKEGAERMTVLMNGDITTEKWKQIEKILKSK